MVSLIPDYTLILPTFNRSEQLRILLTFLERQNYHFPIIVADSSKTSHRQNNKALIENISLNINYQEFEPSLLPFQKFYLATRMVKTSLCSLCADDDIIFPSAISKITNFLKYNLEFSAAHGYYYTFITHPQNMITDLCYCSSSNIDNNPIRRLETLFTNYEAVTYAIYRTPILQDIFHRNQNLNTILGNELLAGALTVVAGKVARLPIIYIGRSSEPSHAYLNWHPIEILFSNPDKLYEEYSLYRQILSDFILKKNNNYYSLDKTKKMIDFIHFSYMGEFLTAPIMRYLLNQIIADHSLSDTMLNLWPLIIEAQNKKLEGENKVTKLQSFFQKFLRTSPLTIEPRELHKGSLLFKPLFIKKLTKISPNNFNVYINDISNQMEIYLKYRL